MLAYLALLGTTLGGLGGLPPWIVAIGVIALTALSFDRYAIASRDASDQGLAYIIANLSRRSIFNAIAATTLAYSGGLLIRMI